MCLKKKIKDSFDSRFKVEDIEKNLKLYQCFLLVGILSYIAWSPLTSFVLNLWEEPFYWRVVGSLGWIIVLALSFKSEYVQKRIDTFTAIGSIMASCHFIWFVISFNSWNMPAIFVIGLFLMVFCSGVFINSHLQLLAYNILVSSSIYFSFHAFSQNQEPSVLLHTVFSSITFFILLHLVLFCKNILIGLVGNSYETIKTFLSKGVGPIIMIKDGVIEYENPAFQELFGQSASGFKESELIIPDEPYNTINGKQVRIDRHKISLKGEDFSVLNIQDVSANLRDNLKRMELSKLASIGELSAGISHEINNPLLQINMLTYQAKTTENKEERDNSLDEISKTVNRIASVVASLREYSESGSRDKKEVSLQAVIEKVVFMTRQKVQSSKVNLVVDIDPTEMISKIQENKIGLVLINIINNSCYAVKDKESKDIKISLKKGLDKTANIIIQDSGDGIPKDIAAKIFDPFFTTKAVGQGSGLGLSESIAIVREHGGSLTLDQNQPPIFNIELPLIEEEK